MSSRVPRRTLPLVAFAVLTFAPQIHAQTPTVTVGGVGYVQYGYGLKTDSTLAKPGHNNNFDVTRAYVNVIGRFSDGVMTRVTADVDGRAASGGQLTIRLKYAFVAWTPTESPLTYKIGMIHTPWVDWEENLWDYRMQGTVAVDRNRLVGSSDFGAGIDGIWNEDKVNMQVGIYNGEGYNAALGDGGKDLEGRVSVRLAETDLPGRTGGLRLTGYAQLGRATGGGDRSRLIGSLSYKSMRMTLGANLAFGQDSTSAATPEQKSSVMSVYGVFNIPDTKVALIGRLDTYDPNTDASSGVSNSAANLATNTQTRAIAGISYTISPNLRFLADLDLNSVENGATNAFDRTRQMLLLQADFRF